MIRKMPKRRDWRKLFVAFAEKAIRASIAHWKRMRRKRPRTYGAWVAEQPDTQSCPLCEFAPGATCKQCPMSLARGRAHCAGTPYQAADAAWKRITNVLFDGDRVPKELIDAWHKSADDMIGALEKLLNY